MRSVTSFGKIGVARIVDRRGGVVKEQARQDVGGTSRPTGAGDGTVGDAPDPLIGCMDDWLADESGYDEETLPALKESLDRNRDEYRKLFGGG